MTKYIDDLTAWVKTRPKKKRMDAALVAFLAVKSDVQDAIKAGYTLSTIHAHLCATGKLTCTYETFRRHVRRLGDVKTVVIVPPSLTEHHAQVKAQSKPPAKPNDGFSFNATPTIEDLI
jgi:hypothetical protein